MNQILLKGKNDKIKEVARECLLGHNMPWQIFSMFPPYAIRDKEDKIEVVLLDEFFFMTTTERKEEVLTAIKAQLEERIKKATVTVNHNEDEKIYVITV